MLQDLSFNWLNWDLRKGIAVVIVTQGFTSRQNKEKWGWVMKKPVKLDDVLDAFELQSDAMRYFLDRRTGVVFAVLEEYLWPMENEIDLNAPYKWQQEQLELAADVEENFEHYAALPEKFEINDYEIMEDFCLRIKNDEKRERLLDAIRGKGAFRRFKSAISSLGLEDNWYQFRSQRYRQMAIEWCESENVEYYES